MPKPSASSSANAGLVSGVVVCALAYAIVRYNVFAGVAWDRLPVYVTNKGMSFAAVVLLAIAYLANRGVPTSPYARVARQRLAKTAGLAGFALAMGHVVMSLLIFSGADYPVLFEGARMNQTGVVCVVSGALATLLLLPPAVSSVQRVRERLGLVAWKRAQQLGYLALAATSWHVLWIGIRNWPAVSRWPGGMPPISLLSFLVCVAPVAAKISSVCASAARAASSSPAHDHASHVR